MFVKIEPTGCCERNGLVQIRFPMYLDKGDYGYDKHYVLVPVIPEGGYTGEVDVDGIPKDAEDYQDWLDSLPKIWQLSPFHNHFVHIEPDTSDKEVKALMQFHLPNFYEAWRQGWGEVKGGMRHGWDVKTRTRPKRYDQLESPEEYLFRKARCEARVEDIKSILAPIATNEKGEIFPASAIVIGPGATDRTSTGYNNYTVIDMAGAADGTGTIDTFELWFRTTDATNTKAGTFQNTSGDNFTPRDYEVIGTVTFGSKQTFSGLDCDVTAGDYAGTFWDGGAVIEMDLTGGSGNYRLAGDQFGGAADYGALQANRAISIYGTGTTPPIVREAAVIIGALVTATRGQLTATRASSVICGALVSATKAAGDAYHRTSSNLIGVVTSATRALTTTRLSSVIIGIVVSAKKGTGRVSSVIVGVLATAIKPHLTITRASSVLIGNLVSAVAIEAVQRAIVYIGVKVTATRNITKILATATVVIGVVATAARVVGYIRTSSTIIGVLVTTVTRQWGRIRASSVIIGDKVTATRKIAATRAGSVMLGTVTTATRTLTMTRKASTIIGALISATYRIVGKVLNMLVYGRAYTDMTVYTKPYYDVEVHH